MFASNKIGIIESSSKSIEKFVELKTGKSPKSQKLFKSRKLAKSEKKLSFDTKENKLSFLIFEARTAFNRLWLAFTKAAILWHFDPECHIQIETNTFGYAIGEMLSQLTLGASHDEVVIEANLSKLGL